MPELPDVEYFASYFKRTSLHKKIDAVKCREASLLQKTSCKNFTKKLKGKEFVNARRRGKLLIVDTSGGKYKLVFHFGMTGDLKYRKITKKNPDYDEVYAKILFQFKNGYELLWINKRKLGKVYLLEDLNEINLFKKMGPEPLGLSQKEFLELLKEKKKKNIKSFLMDQSDIAGIGNEYSNEILFRSGIHPKRDSDSLSEKERKNLYRTMKSTLKKAIKVGPPKGEFGSSWLLTHLKDMKCPKNKNHKLKKERIAGRSAVFCPRHQK